MSAGRMIRLAVANRWLTVPEIAYATGLDVLLVVQALETLVRCGAVQHAELRSNGVVIPVFSIGGGSLNGRV